MRTHSFTAVALLCLSAITLAGCAPPPDEAPAPNLPPKSAQSGQPKAAPPAQTTRPGGPPTDKTYESGMPPDIKARYQAQGAPIK
jgi:hypothetical protein